MRVYVFICDAGCDGSEKTGCCLLVDKEEIGSVGATGMHSRFLKIQLPS